MRACSSLRTRSANARTPAMLLFARQLLHRRTKVHSTGKVHIVHRLAGKRRFKVPLNESLPLLRCQHVAARGIVLVVAIVFHCGSAPKP